METTVDGITAYLVSLAAYGCGEVTCRRIAEHYGDGTHEALLSPDWHRLTEVPGVGEQKPESLHNAYTLRHGSHLTAKERRKADHNRRQRMFFGQFDIHGWTLRMILDRNDYELQVMNGDLGRVTGFDPLRGLLIDFSGRTVALDADHLRHLQLAYAITIHKSQGSEFPVVVIPLTMSHVVMLRRNLLYTAVTRARRLCVIVGSRQALERAVRTEDASVRNTRLEERMNEKHTNY